MAAKPTSPKSQSIKVAALLIVLAAVIWRIFTYDPLVAARALSNELSEAKKQGLITSLADLPTKPTPPIGNAAQEYKAARQLVEGPLWQRVADVVIATRSKAPAEVATARRSRVSLQPAIDLVTRGSARVTLDFGHDPQKGFNTLYGDDQVLQSLVTVLRWDADQLRASGDYEGALGKAEVMAKIARQMQQEPNLVDTALRAHMLLDLYAVLEPIFHEKGKLPSIRARLRQVVGECGTPPNYPLIWNTQLASSLASVDTPDAKVWKSVGPQFAQFDSVVKAARNPLLRDAFKTRIVQFWRTVYANQPKRSDDIYGAYQAIFKACWNQEEQQGFSYTLAKLLYDEYAANCGAFNGAEARIRLVSAGLDWVEGKHDLPQDPNSGKPFLRTTKDGHEVIYGVGPDGKDDKASLKPTITGTPEDLVLRLPE